MAPPGVATPQGLLLPGAGGFFGWPGLVFPLDCPLLVLGHRLPRVIGSDRCLLPGQNLITAASAPRICHIVSPAVQRRALTQPDRVLAWLVVT